MAEKKLAKAFFLDRDGVLNVDTHFVSRPEDFVLYPFVGEAVRRLNEAGIKAVVITNQSAVARGLCTEDTLKEIHDRMESGLSECGAYVDGIYYSTYHPDFSEDAAEALRRKPAPGMLLEAATDLDISLSDSFMVGDNERDILAGMHAGCKTIAVSTGKGYRKAARMADYFFRDLKEAVDFVVDAPFLSVSEEIERRVRAAHTGAPFLIRIGGNTGSGKSTLARWVCDYLNERGLRTGIVALNDWIVPRESRSLYAGMETVFQIERLAKDLSQYLEGESVVVSGYARHPEHSTVPVEYRYSGESVVLVEGVSAFSDALDLIPWNMSIGFEDAGYDLLEHVQEMYRWKGLSDKEVEAVYQHKEEVEYRLVSSWLAKATLILTPRSGVYRVVR